MVSTSKAVKMYSVLQMRGNACVVIGAPVLWRLVKEVDDLWPSLVYKFVSCNHPGNLEGTVSELLLLVGKYLQSNFVIILSKEHIVPRTYCKISWVHWTAANVLQQSESLSWLNIDSAYWWGTIAEETMLKTVMDMTPPCSTARTPRLWCSLRSILLLVWRRQVHRCPSEDCDGPAYRMLSIDQALQWWLSALEVMHFSPAMMWWMIW